MSFLVGLVRLTDSKVRQIKLNAILVAKNFFRVLYNQFAASIERFRNYLTFVQHSFFNPTGMALIIDGEPFNHGLQDENAAQATTGTAPAAAVDLLAHQQNTDVGTTSRFFEIGRGTGNTPAGAVRRGLVFNPGGVGPFTALAWETRNAGTAPGNAGRGWVECRNVIGGDPANEGNVWQPFGGPIPKSESGAAQDFGSLRAAVLYLLTQQPTGLTPPVIGGFNPPSGKVGDAVLINGNNFGTTTGQVFLGTVQCTVSGWSNSQITTKVPVGATTGKFRVTTAGGEDISRDEFVVSVPVVTAVPGPPSGLVADAGNGQAILTWIAPTDTGNLPINDYEIRYRTAGVEAETDDLQYLVQPGPWRTYAHTPRTVANFTVGGLTNNEPYEFEVAAKNTKGTGPYSNRAKATPYGAAIVYRAQTQSYTTTDADFAAKCGQGTHTPITRTSSDGSSTESQAEANRLALAVAKNLAIDAIVCPVNAPGPALGPGTVTNLMLADDIKVGSLAAAANAYPSTERANLTSVEKFLVYIGGRFADILQRLGASEAIVSSISQSVGALSGTVASNTNRIAALEARPTGGTSTGGTNTGGAGGHVIQDEGASLTARANLNFKGRNVTVTDDSASGATVVTIANTSYEDKMRFGGITEQTVGYHSPEKITRLLKDAAISSLSYSINGTAEVVVTFTNNEADLTTQGKEITINAFQRIKWKIVYAANENEGTVTVFGTKL